MKSQHILENRWFILGIGVILGAVVGLLSPTPVAFLRDVLPHLLTAGVVLLAVDWLYLRRHSVNQTETLRIRLLQQVAGQSNHLAVQGIQDMRLHGWLTGENGVLAGADLTGADLHDIDLSQANLTAVNLGSADLHGSILNDAHLTGAQLFSASLNGAVMIRADLSEANLFGAKMKRVTLHDARLFHADMSYAVLETADFSGANLTNANLLSAMLRGVGFERANLSGANLRNADLMNAHFEGTTFSPETVLPDGKKWTSETDLTRFTDSSHAEFWRSSSKLSPAYHGGKTNPDNAAAPKALFDFKFPQEKKP